MKNVVYKSLDELVGDTEERVPLSTRVKKDTKDFLDRESKSRKLTVSMLAAAILDDYAKSLQKNRKGNHA